MTGTRTATSADLVARAGGVVTALRDVAPGPVLIDPEDAVDLVVGLLGCAAAGRPAVLVDAGQGQMGHAAVRSAVAPVAVVTTRRGPGSDGTPDHVGLVRVDPAGTGPFEATSVRPEDPFVVVSTSGSSGEPRLVTIRHTIAVEMAARRRVTDVAASDVVLRPFAASAGFLARMLASVPAGAILFAPDPRRWSRTDLWSAAADLGVTVVNLVPTLFRRLLAGADPLTGVRVVRFGGEPLRRSDVEAARALAPAATVVNGYALTEAMFVAEHAIAPGDPIEDDPVPVGRPLPGRTVTVVDPDGRPVPPGDEGAIVVEAPWVTVTDPSVQTVVGDRMTIRTGDLGRLDGAGLLHHLGRSDRMRKVGGVRVDPAGPEAFLRAQDGVREAVVVLVPEAVRLVAHVVVDPNDPAAPDGAVLLARLRERFRGPSCPVRVEVRGRPVPLLASGKPDVRRLLGGD